MKLPGLFETLKETLRGKSYGRFLANAAVRGVRVSGRAIEVGRGHTATRPSHWRFLDDSAMKEFLTVDIDPSLKPDVVGDVCDRLPFEDGAFDTVLCFNLLEHLEFPERGLKEMRRVLKRGGRFLGSVPFLVNVHADPHDWRRYTATALEKMFKEAGLETKRLEPVGGPFSASYAQIEDILPVPLRALSVPFVLLAEKIVRSRFKAADARWPINYVFEAE